LPAPPWNRSRRKPETISVRPNQPGGGAPYGYVPVADGNGVDPFVTGLRIAPSGAMAAAAGVSQPSFSVEFRVRVR